LVVASVIIGPFLSEEEDESEPAPVVAETPEPTSSPTPTPEPEAEPESEPEQALDEDAVLAMVQEFAELYNAGEYIHASAHFTTSVERDCGGPTALAFALSQIHRMEEIDYNFVRVSAWGADDPNMADIVFFETHELGRDRVELGWEFELERGEWRFDDLFPFGASTFCD
jgi:hypothetical protein